MTQRFARTLLNAIAAMSVVTSASDALATDVTKQVDPTILALNSICDYCIAAAEIGIRRKDKKFVSLKKSDFRSGVNYPNVLHHKVNEWGEGAHSPKYVYNDALESEFIEMTSEYVGIDHHAKKSTDLWQVPVIVRRNPEGQSWSTLIKSQHVCLGSRMLVPTYYFLGDDEKPLRLTPIASQKITSPSSQARQLPDRTHQTICDGELRPAAEIFATFAEQQTAEAVADFKKRTDDAYIRQIVEAATRAWLNENGQPVAPPDTKAKR